MFSRSVADRLEGEAVARVQRERRAVAPVQGRLAPPEQARVLDVVVDQEGVVEQLDRHRRGRASSSGPPKASQRGQAQARAQGLARRGSGSRSSARRDTGLAARGGKAPLQVVGDDGAVARQAGRRLRPPSSREPSVGRAAPGRGAGTRRRAGRRPGAARGTCPAQRRPPTATVTSELAGSRPGRGDRSVRVRTSRRWSGATRRRGWPTRGTTAADRTAAAAVVLCSHSAGARRGRPVRHPAGAGRSCSAPGAATTGWRRGTGGRPR